MKKIIIGICILLVLSFSACTFQSNGQNESNKNQETDATENKEETTITPASSETKAGSKSLKAPILKSITPLDIDEFQIEWSSIDNADGYLLYFKEDNGEFEELADIKSPETKYCHKGLKDNVTYSYKAVAYTENNGSRIQSEDSDIVDHLCNNNLIDFYQPYRSDEYVEYRGSETFIMSGEHRSNSFTLKTNGDGGKDLYADYNLGGKYTAIQFTYGFVDGVRSRAENNLCDATLKIMLDDEVGEVIEINSADLAKTVKVDITNTKKLEFFIQRKDAWWGEFGFANVELFK